MQIMHSWSNFIYMICIISVTYPLIVHIGEVRTVHWRYLHRFFVVDSFSFMFDPFGPMWCPRAKELGLVCTIYIISFTSPRILHIGEVAELERHYLHRYWRVCVPAPIQLHVWPFFNICVALGIRNDFRSSLFVLFLLHIHLSYILVKLEHFNDMICFFIDDFLFWPPFRFMFGHFLKFVML